MQKQNKKRKVIFLLNITCEGIDCALYFILFYFMLFASLTFSGAELSDVLISTFWTQVPVNEKHGNSEGSLRVSGQKCN